MCILPHYRANLVLLGNQALKDSLEILDFLGCQEKMDHKVPRVPEAPEENRE